MALGFFGKNNSKKVAPKKDSAAKPTKAAPEKSSKGALIQLFERGVTLQKEREELLQKGFEEGLQNFEEFNDARLGLAFESFSEDMKKALYEVLFFLHVNDPKFSEVEYTGIQVEHVYGITRETEYEATANLYIEGAPHGVQGIDKLSPVFKEQCFQYLQDTFNMTPSSTNTQEFCPFVSIASLGSIGTVGHKPITSDLDLQVQYELEPFNISLDEWDDDALKVALKKEIQHWTHRIRVKKKIPSAKLNEPNIKSGLQRMAMGQVQKSFPYLFRYLITQKGNVSNELSSKEGPHIRQSLLHEMMALIRKSERRKYQNLYKEREQLLKDRVFAIQDYIQSKFPKAEIYLFVCDNPSYRQGRHGTTLESKEASGSAYEMILTYDVLMPGIQFTPMIPSHFILPKVINNSASFYERLIDYIRFNSVEIYQGVSSKLVDLGATPNLDLKYILAHGGAVYWESFKASSGNLAKALLNLFRIEMLHSPKFLVMIIEIMKAPNVLDKFIKPEDPSMSPEERSAFGLRPNDILQMEETEPLLLKDPWWTKYKIIKIAFAELDYLEVEEQKRISRIIDLCFGLHVKVPEVFVKPGDTRKFETYRERFLVDFLARAFPPGTPQRRFLEHLNIGETKAVIEFEEELKSLFQASLERILNIQKKQGLPDESNQQEFEIWYHYYQKNFDPPSNMVRRSILHHLKIPRLRLQARYLEDQQAWLFRSMQTESKLGKRFDTFGTLDQLPDEVDLMTCPSFIYGIASCVLNSYYGYVNQGSLKEQKSRFEFDSAAMRFGDQVDQSHAYIRPDTVERIIAKINNAFPHRTYHYMDCVSKPRKYVEVIFLMHVMRYGQLSILYRDNLTNWYLDEFQIPGMKKEVKILQRDYQRTFKSKAFQSILMNFLKENDIRLSDSDVHADYWFNPNCAETSHSAQKVVAKEEDVSKMFGVAVEQIYQRHMPTKLPPISNTEDS